MYYLPRLEYARVVLVLDYYPGIGFVVFQQDVVVGWCFLSDYSQAAAHLVLLFAYYNIF